MNGDETIRDIKDRLREEGYTSETIGEVLREVNRSFLADDAGEVIRQTRVTAINLESVLTGIYEALIEEPVLDLRIEGSEELPIAGAPDVLDLYLVKGPGERLTISFETRHEHLAEREEAITLGKLRKTDSSTPVSRRVVVARTVIRPAERRRGAPTGGASTYEIRFDVNRHVLEAGEVRHEAGATFAGCLTFVDYASDRYACEAYPILIRAIARLPERIGTYLGKKREFLDNFDFT